MECMFYCCNELASLDLNSFDTAKVTSMGEMFAYCRRLSALDLSGFDTSNVTSMSWMFYCCESLTTLDLSGFDASKVEKGYLGKIFYGCNQLANLICDDIRIREEFNRLS